MERTAGLWLLWAAIPACEVLAVSEARASVLSSSPTTLLSRSLSPQAAP
jgi:hypothetical protein